MAAARGRRGALAAGGAAAHASLLLALLRWRAARTDLALPAVASAAWGACAALWDVLQVCLYLYWLLLVNISFEFHKFYSHFPGKK